MSVADIRPADYREDPLLQLGLTRDGARVLIVGLGKTGYSIARFLAARGIRFAVTDSREQPPHLAELRQDFPDAAVFLGGFKAEAFAAATHLVVSPGVALEEPAIVAAARRGVAVLGDLDLFAVVARAPVAAITGSNGKSTVTTLLGLMAETAGRKVAVGGNLGTPMLDLLSDQAELYVLELSSFQLERSELLEPVAATVLNITPDHMDRYPDLAAYAAAKQRIFRGRGLMVLNLDDPVVTAMAESGREIAWFSVDPAAPMPPLAGTDRHVIYRLESRDGVEWLVCRDEPVIPATEVGIQGRHNLANALAALALGDALELSRSAMATALRRFDGLDHRMQRVAEIDGVVYINDSKATNVGACMAALQGLDRKAVLIAGGDGKGADFTLLRPVVQERVSALVLLGKDAPLLETALADLVPTVRVDNLRQAVPLARSLARPGEAVLLAPACASLDQFKDYQERGRVFADAVGSLKP